MILKNNSIQLMEEIETRRGKLTFRLSNQPIDNEWDHFVESSDLGHFEQTSRWAVAKDLNARKPYRIILSKDGAIIGGFQILTRQHKRFINLGLLKKGPIVIDRDPAILKLMINYLKKTINNDYSAVIIQPPDFDSEITDIMINSGFIPNYIGGIIKCANVLIDLTFPEEVIYNNLKRQKKQNIKIAKRAGVVIRQGYRKELETFFNLMKSTCLRRGVKPNPPTKNMVEKIWDTFSPNNIVLFLAEYEKNIISGVLVITCGTRASLWKFGWSGQYGHIRPNDLLFWEIFKWAKSEGFKYADLGEFGSYYAKGSYIYDNLELCKNWDDVRYKTGFGGDILKLQPGFLYFSNSMAEGLYRSVLPRLINLPVIKSLFNKLL